MEVKRECCNFHFSGITKIAKKAEEITKFFLMLFLKQEKSLNIWWET